MSKLHPRLFAACLGFILSSLPLSAQASPPQAQTPQAKTATTEAAESKNAALAAPADVGRYPLGDYLGLTVQQIAITGVPTSDVEKLRSVLIQREGEPLERTKLERSIQALYNTGWFNDIHVEAERQPDNSVALTFVTSQNYFVGAVSLAHAPQPPPTRNQLLGATKLDLGELLTDAKLQSAIDGMKQVLVSNGYHNVKISDQQALHPDTGQVDTIFKVEAGRAAHVGEVQVTGDSGFAQEEVLEIARLRPGDRVSNERDTRALQRLRSKYQKQDRLEAQVSVIDKAFRPANNTEDYVVNANRGPQVIIKVSGANVRKGLLKKYVPVFEENAVDNDLLNEGRRNLIEYFQTQGFFDATVELRQDSDIDQNRRTITYDVNKGKRHKLVAIQFEGNHYFYSDLLSERLSIRTRSFVLNHGLFSRARLARDVESIQNLYVSNGFSKVQVKTETLDDYQGVIGRLKVVFQITEGPQTRVAALNVAGNHSVPLEEILKLVNSTEGQPFSEANVAADRDAVINYYFDRGFPKVEFESTAKQVSADPPRVELSYTIGEGQQILVDHVFVSGLEHTRDFVVQRELQVRPGAPLSQSDLLDTQRRLYDLGIFNQVNVAVQNPDGDSNWKNVLLQAEEAKRYTFTYGVGLEVQTGTEPGGHEPQGRTGVSPRFTFDVTRINFRGRNDTIIFKSTYGRLEQLALLSYEQPHWLNNEHWKLTFTGFYNTTRDVRTFTAERLEGSVQAQQTISKATIFLYGFVYRRVKVDPRTLAIDPNLIPLLSKPVRVGMPTFTFVRDKRDDPLDAHRGNYTTVNTGISAAAFGSEASFGRVLVTNSTYRQFRHNRWVFARNTSVGAQNPFANTIVPLAERFYGGGPYSLRGFALNQAGPRDLQTGFPVGGNGLFLNQFELRMPPLTLPFFKQDLSPVIFHDAGNVFAGANDIFPSMFRVSQQRRQQCEITTGTSSCDFNYFSHTLGGGLRYKTPIGPVRIDMGYDLNPAVFPIREQSRFETLRHFNLFFSIGQTF